VVVISHSRLEFESADHIILQIIFAFDIESIDLSAHLMLHHLLSCELGGDWNFVDFFHS
jgi:hypothetical protein